MTMRYGDVEAGKRRARPRAAQRPAEPLERGQPRPSPTPAPQAAPPRAPQVTTPGPQAPAQAPLASAMPPQPIFPTMSGEGWTGWNSPGIRTSSFAPTLPERNGQMPGLANYMSVMRPGFTQNQSILSPTSPNVLRRAAHGGQYSSEPSMLPTGYPLGLPAPGRDTMYRINPWAMTSPSQLGPTMPHPARVFPGGTPGLENTTWGTVADDPSVISGLMNRYMDPRLRPYLPMMMPPRMFGMQSPFQMGGLQGTQNPFWR